MDIKKCNYYIEEQEIVMNQKIFIINVIIKDQQLLYIKMKNAFLEVIILIHGHLIINGFLPNCFIFSLVNIYNVEPIKFPKNNNDNYAVYHGSHYGPAFGGGFDIASNYDKLLDNAHSNFPYSYQDTSGKGKSIFTGNTNNNNLEHKEIEVFNLSK